MKNLFGKFVGGLALLVACFVMIPNASGVTLLSEDWEAETLGDNLSELTNWTAAVAPGAEFDGTIIDSSGDQVLRVDTLVSTDTAGIRHTFDMTPFVGGSVSIKANLTTQSTSGWFGIFLSGGGGTHRLQFNQSINGTTLKRDADIFGTGFAIPSAGVAHEWELRLTQDASGFMTVEAFIDGGAAVSSYTETLLTGATTFSSTMTLSIYGFNSDPVDVTYGDISVTGVPVPEPSSAILALLGCLGMIGVTRRRKR